MFQVTCNVSSALESVGHGDDEHQAVSCPRVAFNHLLEAVVGLGLPLLVFDLQNVSSRLRAVACECF